MDQYKYYTVCFKRVAAQVELLRKLSRFVIGKRGGLLVAGSTCENRLSPYMTWDASRPSKISSSQKRFRVYFYTLSTRSNCGASSIHLLHCFFVQSKQTFINDESSVSNYWTATA